MSEPCLAGKKGFLDVESLTSRQQQQERRFDEVDERKSRRPKENGADWHNVSAQARLTEAGETKHSEAIRRQSAKDD